MTFKIVLYALLVLLVVALVAVNIFYIRDRKARARRGEEEEDLETWIW